MELTWAFISSGLRKRLRTKPLKSDSAEHWKPVLIISNSTQTFAGDSAAVFTCSRIVFPHSPPQNRSSLRSRYPPEDQHSAQRDWPCSQARHDRTFSIIPAGGRGWETPRRDSERSRRVRTGHNEWVADVQQFSGSEQGSGTSVLTNA